VNILNKKEMIVMIAAGLAASGHYTHVELFGDGNTEPRIRKIKDPADNKLHSFLVDDAVSLFKEIENEVK
jgi:hypothetical protein